MLFPINSFLNCSVYCKPPQNSQIQVQQAIHPALKASLWCA